MAVDGHPPVPGLRGSVAAIAGWLAGWLTVSPVWKNGQPPTFGVRVVGFKTTQTWQSLCNRA